MVPPRSPGIALRTVGGVGEVRGPKNHVLPEERIQQLAFDGMSSKAIAAKLQGVGVEDIALRCGIFSGIIIEERIIGEL